MKSIDLIQLFISYCLCVSVWVLAFLRMYLHKWVGQLGLNGVGMVTVVAIAAHARPRNNRSTIKQRRILDIDCRRSDQEIQF